MRGIILIAAVVALVLPGGAGSQQKRTPQLDGHWRCIRSEGPNGINASDKDWTFIIAGNKVSWISQGSNQITGPFDFSADPDTMPASLISQGQHGIYRFDADTLIIIFFDTPNDRATTFDLSKQTRPGRMLTFRRIKDAR